MIDAIRNAIMGMPGVEARHPPLAASGWGFGLTESLARGQPEAFIASACWVHLRPEGALHLSLRPEWAQKVLNKGWACLHPFARYMAGAIPPQSLVVFAPRDPRELRVMIRIVEAAHAYALGRIGTIILPDTRW